MGTHAYSFNSGTTSLWSDTANPPDLPRLSEDLHVDVCIVGGGIGGLTTAYLLGQEGLSVAVLESQHVGEGQTGQTTAHFTYALDDRYFELEKLFGREKTRLAAESHREAIQRATSIAQHEKIACDLKEVSGYLFAGASDPGILDREFEAVQRAGLTGIYRTERAPLRSFDTGPALVFPQQMTLHPLKYLRGLCAAILRQGGRIFQLSHVVEIHGGTKAFVKTNEGRSVHAEAIVVATNTPVNNVFAIHTKQAPYRSYVIGFKVPRGSIEDALYWDTEDPYHYIRLHKTSDAHDTLIVGGEDHKTGQHEHPEDCFTRLERWTREHFPMAQESTYRWSGQVMEPVDGLADLGHNPLDRNNVYVITGDSGNGMTHTTIGAMIIADQIQGRKNAWEDLYSPSRVTLKSLGEFTKENANVAAQYRDWLSPPDLHSAQEIYPGEGGILQEGAQKIAVFKHKDGRLEVMSAVCPHLKGIVRWNTVEKSWDCPCHGSRFDCHGRVIEGPALLDLETIPFNPIEKKVREFMSIRTFTLIAGWAFLLVGIAGFVPALTTNPAFHDPSLHVESGHARIFGLFPVNVLHNLVHLTFGLWALLVYRNVPRSRIFCRSNAIIYGVLTIAGLIPTLNTVFGTIPLHGHDVWLHAVIALGTGYFGFVHVEKRAIDSPMLQSIKEGEMQKRRHA